MNLRSYEGKKVIIELLNKKIYRGKVLDFIYAEDNNPQKNSLIISAKGYDYPIEVYEDEIKSIEMM